MKEQGSKAVLYLHGFASGPASTKANFFASRLGGLFDRVFVPDLNGESFEKLTLSSQLGIVGQSADNLDDEDDLLIVGSSMGGLLATLAAPGIRQTRALVLLAPGFGLPRRWTELIGAEGLERWEATGYTEVFHYGMNRSARLGYEFIRDAQGYATDGLKTAVPTLVFHGIQDETVPVAESVEFARQNPDTVELHLLEDGHELIEPLPAIWDTTRKFLVRVGIMPESGFRGALPCQQHKLS